MSKVSQENQAESILRIFADKLHRNIALQQIYPGISAAVRSVTDQTYLTAIKLEPPVESTSRRFIVLEDVDFEPGEDNYHTDGGARFWWDIDRYILSADHSESFASFAHYQNPEGFFGPIGNLVQAELDQHQADFVLYSIRNAQANPCKDLTAASSLLSEFIRPI